MAVLEFKKKYQLVLWSRYSNMTQKNKISTVFKSNFHFDNANLKLKLWAILSAYPFIYSFITISFSHNDHLLK